MEMNTGIEFVELETSSSEDRLIIIPPPEFFGDNTTIQLHCPGQLFDFVTQGYIPYWNNIPCADIYERIEIAYLLHHSVVFVFAEINNGYQRIHIYVYGRDYFQLMGKLYFGKHNHPIRECTITFNNEKIHIKPSKIKFA